MRDLILKAVCFLLLGLVIACGESGPLSQKALNGTWKLDSYRRAREKRSWKAGVKHMLENRATSLLEGTLKFDGDDFQMVLHAVAVVPGYRQQVSDDTLSGTYSIEDSTLFLHAQGYDQPDKNIIHRNRDTLTVKELEHTLKFVKLPAHQD